ncbi:winged helix-turn-helix domain-containing protein [Streptomyces davaonensis]|nr:winged helix-turn-helix domain-containing protein [Streptomyces davaonensis]
MVRESQRILETLLSQIADGTLGVGDRLPSQRELAREFGVSRDTVQRALRELADMGPIMARQGTGSVVRLPAAKRASPDARRRPTGLGPHIDIAFTHPTVTIDAFALTGESLDPHLRLSAERVREGIIRPESISVRVLLPRIDDEFRLATPVGDTRDPRPLDRLRAIRERHTTSIGHVLRELQAEGLVPSVSFACREIPVIPMQKLYLLNDSEVITGFYSVIRRPVLLDDDEQIEIYDVLGLAATLHHHSAAGEHPAPESVTAVARARRWFEHVWSNAALSS